MDREAVVLNISSDEEEVGWGEDDNRGVDGGDDYDWISELLDEVEKETDNGGGDDDDVVVVDEKLLLNSNPKQRLKSSSVVVNSLIKDVDDDCVILDGDPDKPVEVENNPVGEFDDLLVVSEKGQVACRDYPHARHLCAKFPFNASPHESHCDQCHCYVCDSRVPCVHWGTGISSIDHCHATDKEEFWVLQRKSLRNDDQSPKPISKVSDISLYTRQAQINQVPPPTLMEPNYVVPQNQVCRPMSVRACTPTTNFSLPNIINPSRNHRPGGYVVPRNKFQTNGCNNFTPRDRRHSVGNLGPQSISPRPMFKRTGSFGASTTTNRCVSSNSKFGSNLSQNHPLPPAEPSSYWTNSGSTFANQDPSQQQIPSGFVNSAVPCQPLASSLPSVVGCYVSAVPSEPNANLQVPSEPYTSSVIANSLPSQSQVYSQPISVSNDSGSIFHQNQSQGAPLTYPSLTDIDLSWVAPSSQINQTPVAESAARTDEASLPMEFDHQQFPGANPASLGFQYESWVLDSQPLSGLSLHPGLNVLSPDPPPIDAGFLFDF
ncbi:hypothetical protein LguiB_030765 [Lonicera macranthoides]